MMMIVCKRCQFFDENSIKIVLRWIKKSRCTKQIEVKKKIFRTVQKWEKMWVCLITSTIYWRLICRCRRHHTHKLDVVYTVSLHDNDNREWRRKQQRHRQRQRQRQCPTIGSCDSGCVCCRCSANGFVYAKAALIWARCVSFFFFWSTISVHWFR